jgi:type II secretory pathway component PulM
MMKDKIIAHWQNLQTREQKMLIIGGACLALLFFFLLIDAGISRSTLMAQKAAKEQQLLEWMQPVVQQIMIARTQKDGEPITAANLLAQVEISLAEAGLSGQIESLNLIANNQVQLAFTKVVYEALVDWLYALSHQGIIIHEFTAIKTAETGMVQANLLLSAIE